MKIRTALGLITLALIVAPASADDWRLLGAHTVDRGADHDQIQLTASAGYRRLKLKVEHAPIEINRIEVVYANGEPDWLDVREHIRAGGETHDIDLKGGDRVARRIVLWCHADAGHERAVISVWGRH
jgi:hypothetical protein